MMKRGLPQAKIRVYRSRMSDNRKHRQVADAIGISERVAETNSLALGKGPDPGSFRCRGKYRRQQASRRHPVDELEAVGDVVLDTQIFH